MFTPTTLIRNHISMNKLKKNDRINLDKDFIKNVYMFIYTLKAYFLIIHLRLKKNTLLSNHIKITKIAK